MSEFKEWPKTPRFFDSTICVTEKLDGTNSLIYIAQEYQDCGVLEGETITTEFKVGSRSRWITPEDDNYGFAKWAYNNKEELISLLGPGYHYGEWWGQGIQRKYNMHRKVFSLFNVNRWGELWNHDPGESICDVVPFKIFELSEFGVDEALNFDTIIQESNHYFMRKSIAAEKYGKEFTNPEGFCIYHDRSKQYFKVPVNK